MGAQKAEIYRKVMEKSICPHGLKAKALLENAGYEVADHHLTSRDEVDAFMAKHDVKTTPQVFIDGERIGGHDDLRRHLGKPVPDKNATSYKPIIAIFAMTFLMALAGSWLVASMLSPVIVFELFIAFSMCVLAIQKLRDLESFTSQFITYDLLGRRWVRYAYIYPFAEGFVGVGMIAGALFMPFVAPIALFIGGIGAVSVVKAVYIDQRDLKCACVGGNSNVPLGFVSLLENVMMVGVALWMLARLYL